MTPELVTPQTVTPYQRSTGLNTIEPTDTAATTGDGLKEGTEQSESCPSLAALGGGLGGLCAILAILLVGVVMGWVWSSHRRSLQKKYAELLHVSSLLNLIFHIHSSDPSPCTLICRSNPSYAVTTSPSTDRSISTVTPPAIYEVMDDLNPGEDIQ